MKMTTGVAYYLLSSAALVVAIVVNGLNGVPNNGIFNNTIGNVSRKYETLITPGDYAFSIWGIIYLFQISMMIYYLTTLCRSNALGPVYKNPVVLPASFHIFYTITSLANISWMFAFDREKILIAAICILFIFVFGNAALFINFKLTLDNRSKMERYSKGDLTATYILVQNGMDLYFTWTLCALTISIAMVLQYCDKVGLFLSGEVSATVALSVFLVIIFIFGVLDVTYGFEAGRHVFTGYLVLIWALVGIFVERFDINDRNTIMELAAMVIVVAFLIAKIVLVATRPKRYNNSYSKLIIGK